LSTLTCIVEHSVMMAKVMPPSTQETHKAEKAAMRRRQRRAKKLKDARNDMLRALEEWAKPRPRSGVLPQKWFLAKGLFALTDDNWQALITSLPPPGSLFLLQGNKRSYGGSKALDISCQELFNLQELFATVLSPYNQHSTGVKLIEHAANLETQPWHL
jgi:hypothetical protein